MEKRSMSIKKIAFALSVLFITTSFSIAQAKDDAPFVDADKAIQQSIDSDNQDSEKSLNNAQTEPSQAPEDAVIMDDLAFKRGLNNGGIFTVQWSKEPKDITFDKEGHELIVTVKDAYIDEVWRYAIDTAVFNTIVNTIDVSQKGQDVVLKFKMNQNFTFHDNLTSKKFQLTLDKQDTRVSDFNTKKPISLSFQNTPVRTILQSLAQFAGMNLVVSEDVGGHMSLNIKNVPWEEALEMVMTSQGLGERKIGSILYIAPRGQITQQEQAASEARQASEATEPIETAYVKLNYATAANVADVIRSEGSEVLTDRGSISTDGRTNTLVISDVGSHIGQIKEMITELDHPVQQVLIEGRIVEVNKSSGFDLGINYNAQDGDDSIKVLPSFIGSGTGDSGDTNPPGSSTLGVSFAGLFDGIDLDMEISALQSEGAGELISSPHVLVQDNEEAFIKQGKEVPFRESTAGGAAAVAFKQAVLELQVTPQIAPNGYVIMDVTVRKDSVSPDSVGEEPILDTKEAKTKLMVKSGETIVLGGILESQQTEQNTKVPFLGDMPLLGWLFSSRSTSVEDRELLIFLTPKIVESDET